MSEGDFLKNYYDAYYNTIVLKIYDNLMREGQSIRDIDEMDVLLYLELVKYRANTSQVENNENISYIDQNPYI